jgi:SH3-like domain-containing protein
MLATNYKMQDKEVKPRVFNILFFLLLAVCFLPLSSVLAAETVADTQHTESRALPRFVSIRTKEINIRTGPGERYPIDWVMKAAKGWPLQVVAEYENWRKIKDWEGNIGWVHRAMLNNDHSGVVQVEMTMLRNAPSDTAPPLAHVKMGVRAEIKKCENSWCEVKFEAGEGWLPAKTLWGAED